MHLSKLNNEEINALIDKYIKADEREKLWDLAFECKSEIFLNKIADYYIEVRDSFNVCELLSIGSDYIDLDYIFNKIICTGDKEFIFLILNNGTIKSVVNYKYFSKLEKACS